MRYRRSAKVEETVVVKTTKEGKNREIGPSRGKKGGEIAHGKRRIDREKGALSRFSRKRDRKKKTTVKGKGDYPEVEKGDLLLGGGVDGKARERWGKEGDDPVEKKEKGIQK